MKRSIFNSIILILIFVVLVAGVVILNNPDIIAKKSEKDSGFVPVSNPVTLSVSSGRIDHTYALQGLVGGDNEEPYSKTLTIENAKADNTSLSVARGADFSEGEQLVSVSNEPLKAKFNGKLIDYRFDAENKTLALELLDYDSLCINAMIDAEKLKYIDYNTPVKAIYYRKKYEAKIKHIGYEIEEGMVAIKISLPEELRILPGSELGLEFIVGSTEKGMYIPSSVVLYDFDGSAYCLTYDEGGNLVRRNLIVGENFSVEDADGYVFEYTEIIAGLSPGEKLIIEAADDIQPSIEGIIDD